MKKALSLLLCLMMALSLVSAANAEAAESVTLTIFKDGTYPTNILDNPIMKQIEEKTGVVLDFSPYMGGTGNAEQIASMLLASGEYPDIWVLGDEVTLRKMIENNLLMPLDDLIAEYGADITANADEALAFARMGFGTEENYLVPIQVGGVNWYPAGYDNIFSYRWDLWKKSGMEEIKTWEQLIEFLKYCKEAEPVNANGQTNYAVGIPLGGDGWTYLDWNTTHFDGVGSSGLVNVDFKTDTVISRFAEDSYYFQGAEFFFKLNQLGLLDPESSTLNGDQIREKGAAHRYFLGLANWQIGWPNDTARNAQLEGELTGVGYAPLAITDGEYVFARTSTTYGNGTYYAISATCKDPVAAMKYINYSASWEGSELMSNGPEGIYWEYVDGAPKWNTYEEQQVVNAETGVEWDNKKVGISYVAPNLMVNGYRDNAATGWKTIYSQQDPAQYRASMSDAEEAFCDEYGYAYGMEYVDINFPYNTFDFSLFNTIPAIDPASDLAFINIDCEQIAKEYSVRLVFAADQAEYDSVKAEMLKRLEQAGYQKLLDYYVEGYEQVKAQFAEAFN